MKTKLSLRRLLSVLLCAAMIVCLMPTAFADGITITSQPASVTVTEGSSASFSVSATGTGLTYQWQFTKSGEWKNCTSTTAGYNTATLKPVGTAARNGYQYRCIITDANGNTVTSNAAKLTVKASSALAITTQPANATVTEGSSASFKVVATGAGLSYQWQFSKNGTDWKNCTSTTEGYNTATLKPVGTAARNGYQYRCIITDANGNTVTSNAAKLTVKASSALAITTQPANATVNEGSSASFKVVATGAGLTYQWQFSKNGTDWKNCTSTTAGYNTATLKPVGTAARNGYQYRCIITDANGNTVTSNAAKLTVKASSALAITTQPANATVNEGSSASFKVVATGTGLSYQWQFSKNGTDWKNCTSTTEGYNTATLKPVATAARNGYQYRCIITDANGNTVTSNAAKLTVKASSALTITTQPKTVIGEVDQEVRFSVKVSGGKQPYSYQWESKFTEAAESWYTLEVENDTVKGINTDTLRVCPEYGTIVARSLFRCVVTDADGKQVTSQAAYVDHALAFYYQSENKEVCEGDIAYFSILAFGGEHPYTYQWQYKTTSGTATWKNCSSATDGYNTETIYPVGTAARNGYQYRCVVTDANGNKITSNASVLTVKPGLTITTQPKTVEADLWDEISFSVKVSGGLAPLSYRWQYRINTGGFSWNYIDNLEDSLWTSGYDTDTLHFEADGDKFKYEYRCVITDAKDNSVTSDAVCLNKKSLDILTQPVDVLVNVGDMVSFTVAAYGGTAPYSYRWQAKFGDSWGFIDYDDDDIEGAYTDTIQVYVNASTLLYAYRCVITDAKGNSVTSGAVRVIKALTISQQPQSIYAKLNDDVSFKVTADGGTKPYRYRWQYRFASPAGVYNEWKNIGSSAWALNADTDTLSFTVSSGDFENKWQYRCIITDADGTSVTSNAVQVLKKPLTVSSLDDFYADEGDLAGFHVVASGGDEPYTYQWQYRYIIGGTYCGWTDITADNDWCAGYDGEYFLFWVSSLDLEQGRQYRCIVTDANGDSGISGVANVYRK